MLKHFNMKDAEGFRTNEYDLSFADTGSNFIIAAHVQRLDENCSAMDNDILLMRFNKKGHVATAIRVDIDNYPGIGKSIFFRKKTIKKAGSILVASELLALFLTAEQDPTLKNSKDIFLLETHKNMNNVTKLEVFGDAADGNRGVDFILSQDL